MRTATVTSRLWRLPQSLLTNSHFLLSCAPPNLFFFFLMIWLDAAILEEPLWERKAFDSSYVKTLEEVLDLPSPWYQENAKGVFRVEHLKRATVSQNEQTHLCECECVLFKESGSRLPPSCVLLAPVKDFLVFLVSPVDYPLCILVVPCGLSSLWILVFCL